MTQQPFHQHLAAWKQAVAGQKHPPLPLEIVAETMTEFFGWQAQLQATKIEAEKAGYLCQFNKGGTQSGRVAAWITSNGFTLKIAFTASKPAKRTNTTATSRSAYHSQDFTTQSAQIAKAIFDHSILDGDMTRKEIEVWTGLTVNAVTGRVKELLQSYENGGYMDKSGEYRLVLTAPRLSRCVGSSDKLNEAMRFVKVEPVPESGAQTELF